MTGFHAAFFAARSFFVAGIVLMVTMLKRSDVEQVDVDRPVTESPA